MYQQITLIGRLGSDPTMRFTPNGDTVTSFSLAVNNGKDKKPVWVKVTAWDKQAENANEYLRKGSLVQVVGKISVDSETGNPRVYKAKSGDWASSLDVSATTITYLSKDDTHGTTDRDTGGYSADDEIPF